MARPTKAKEPKPKAEGGGDGKASALGGFTGIIVNAVLTIVLMGVFIGANYWMVNNIVNNKGGPEATNEEHHGEGGIESAMTFPYDLDDFIINLNNPGEKRYLKVKISLDITREESEPAIGEAPAASGGGGHGGGHGGGGETADPKVYYTTVMEPFKMPIRDVVISKMSSLSAEELSSITGKQQAKDSIKEEINTILPENRQIQRVNFGEFIIQ